MRLKHCATCNVQKVYKCRKLSYGNLLKTTQLQFNCQNYISGPTIGQALIAFELAHKWNKTLPHGNLFYSEYRGNRMYGDY